MHGDDGASAFHLSKWYMDVADKDGRVGIVYAARIRWRRLSFDYGAFLSAAPGGRLVKTGGLGRNLAPRLYAGGADVDDGLGAGGWTFTGPGVEAELFRGDSGAVHWRCVAPAASAWLRLSGGFECRGRGYLEKLEMTMPPWRLPIRQLRWGRFIAMVDAESATPAAGVRPLRDPAGTPASVVWIEWQGPRPYTLVLLNGQVRPEARVVADGVEGDGWRLTLGAGRVLTEGDITGSHLRFTRAWARRLPLHRLAIHETKWHCVAVLAGPAVAGASGVAIHEVAMWPDGTEASD